MSVNDVNVIKLPSGLNVELSLVSPRSNDPSCSMLAVLLHPWSWLGGRMNDPLSIPLLAKGYHVLRYNSRGVGRTTGWASFTGIQESEDLRELIDWALTKLSNVQHILIIGYSYGSLICSRYLPHPTIKTSHILLSYPLGPRSFLTLFRSKSYESALSALISHATADVLILYGDMDEFTSISDYKPWIENLQLINGKGTSSTGKLQSVQISGGTHFWRDKDGREMLQTVELWLDRP